MYCTVPVRQLREQCKSRVLTWNGYFRGLLGIILDCDYRYRPSKSMDDIGVEMPIIDHGENGR